MSRLLIPRRDLLIGGAAVGLASAFPRPALAAGKSLWGWSTSPGNGTGTATTYSVPIQLSAAGTSWSDICNGAGSVMAAIKTDGTLWTWGGGYQGGTGQGNTLNISSPVQLGAL